jgi:hypothetical protein
VRGSAPTISSVNVRPRSGIASFLNSPSTPGALAHRGDVLLDLGEHRHETRLRAQPLENRVARERRIVVAATTDEMPDERKELLHTVRLSRRDAA